jgi:ankyrin repeat protein
MDTRMGWNLDSTEHATFNWIRPIPACSKAPSPFSPSSAAFLDEARIISGPTLFMRKFKRQFVFGAGVVLLILFWAIAVGPEPPARISVSPGELVRAVTIQRDSLIDLYLIEHVDPNGHDAQGRTPLLIATSQQDWKSARRLVDAGALIDLADKNGFTPLMAAAMHGNLEIFRLLLVRTADLHAEARTKDGRDLLGMALDGGNQEIIKTVVERLPPASRWTRSTRRALTAALQVGNKEQIRLLLGKHSAPPTPEGKNVPFLAYSIAGNNSSLFTTLLACGADPNTVLPSHCDKDFLALLDKGANRNRLTSRDKMSALDIAAETGHWRAAQILLGGGPSPDRLRLEISLGLQRVALVKNGVPVYRTQCSTGRAGYSTKRGEFVITNKERNHRSTIYHVDMPYFMRLSCLDFGMHAGYVPNYPASHGCIRLPEEAARKFFSELPVGTLVTVQ